MRLRSAATAPGGLYGEGWVPFTDLGNVIGGLVAALNAPDTDSAGSSPARGAGEVGAKRPQPEEELGDDDEEDGDEPAAAEAPNSLAL